LAKGRFEAAAEMRKLGEAAAQRDLGNALVGEQRINEPCWQSRTQQ
jgi:hypothetical protein